VILQLEKESLGQKMDVGRLTINFVALHMAVDVHKAGFWGF
jgi:hypothetical protein